MHKINTLRVRFALWVAALLVFALVTFGAFLYFSLSQGLAKAIDDSLQLGATQAIAGFHNQQGRINFSDADLVSGAASALQERGLTLRLLDPAGHSLNAMGVYANLPTPPEFVSVGQQNQSAFVTLTDATTKSSVRFYTAPVIDDGRFLGVVQVAQSLDGMQDTLNRLLSALLLGGAALTVFAAAAGYVLAARALAPIDHITQTARRISAQDLSERLNLPATSDEVGRLAATFDLMLSRLDESFRHERQFIADASHELRTPLAAMQAILQVTRTQTRSTEQYAQALADISFETERLASLTQNLLDLAQGAAVPAVDSFTPVDLSTLLTDVCDSLRPQADAKNLELECNTAPALSLYGDSDSLVRLFVNLIGNAIKYTDRGKITVTARAEGKQIYVSVTDTGPGISADHLPRIFDRFYRTDSSRSTSGAGLGLAIALAIARTHGGTIQAESEEGVGSTFTVLLGTT